MPDLTTLNGMEFYRKEIYCDNGYTYSNETSICYKVVNTNNSWTDAKQFCNDESTSPIILEKADKIDALKNLPDNLCDGAFVPYINKCYWLTPTPATYYPSQTTCIESGGTPASFPDVDTYIYVVNALGINGSTNDVWIGVNDFNMDGDWRNYDQSFLAFNDYLYDYTTFGTWNNRDALAIVPTDNLLWWERNEYTISIKMMCEKDIVDDYWIGGSDETNEGTWLWEDGQTINMSLFRTGEPNGNSVQNCLSLTFSSSGNQFEDEDCSVPKKSICQRI
ncbi:Hypothetical predicted protein [Mytilus galloprovincialis]|uniref:C-type lectin domain-containing protein n=1 Tax=Mytilus galloprovincialis TaxID=29158 RepID=A0A8B6H7R1_MYTGA|nr:Hypothetical predicted protein [Mytilus galloprovincialis]